MASRASSTVLLPALLGVLLFSFSCLLTPSWAADAPLQACTEVQSCKPQSNSFSVWHQGIDEYFCCPNGERPVCESWYPPSKCVCPPAFNASCPACWEVHVGSWSACSATCGGGVSVRSVRCTTDGNITSLPVEMCGDPLVYANSTQCNTFPCTPPQPAPGYVWYADPWMPCDTFHGCFSFRGLYCLDAQTNAKVDFALCDAATQPATNQSCAGQGGECAAPKPICGGLPAVNASGSSQYQPYSEPTWTGLYMLSNATTVNICDPTQCCCPSATASVNVEPTGDATIKFTLSSSGVNCSGNEYFFSTGSPLYPVADFIFEGYYFVLQHNSNQSTLTATPVQSPYAAAQPAVCGFTLVRVGPPILSDDDSGLTNAQKAGIIIGAVGAAALLLGACYCLWQRQKRRQEAGEKQRLLKQTLAA